MANTSRIISNNDGFFKEEVTLDNTQFTNKEIILTNTPASPEQLTVLPVSGVPQKYTTDFIVVANTLSWDGRGLETILEIGDTLVIIYSIN